MSHTIDITKPLELFNPKTGETKDVPNTTYNKHRNYFDTYPVTVEYRHYRNYTMEGNAVITDNPWTIRNKVDVNLDLDLSKPLYVDGVRVYLIHQRDIDLAAFWQKKWDGSMGYVNVSTQTYSGIHSQHDNTTFYRRTKTNDGTQRKIIGTISNNPGEIKMLDLNKPLVVNGKDAKVIHKFDSGKLAVVVDGYGEVQHFNADGTRGFGGPPLKNKVVETFRFVNVRPAEAGTSPNNENNTAFYHKTLAAAVSGRSDYALAQVGGFRVKQTLIDGKVVKSELID
jgi:hypothetical protein